MSSVKIKLTLFNPKNIIWSIALFFSCFKTLAKSDENCLGFRKIQELSLESVVNSKELLVAKGGGEVYSFDGCEKLIRIDNSFKFKNRYGAFNFLYKNTLYSFGGYGIFQFNNSIISFSEDTGKWKLYYPNSLNDSPKARRFMIGGISDDQLIIGPGTSELFNIDTSEISSKISTDFWSFDLNKNKWVKLIEENLIKVTKDSRIFNLGEISIISDHKLTIVDYSKKELRISDNPNRNIFHNADKIDLDNDQLIIYIENETIIIPIKNLSPGKFQTLKLNLNNESITSYIMFSCLLVSVIILFFLARNTKTNEEWHSALSKQQILLVQKLEGSNEPILYRELYELYDRSINYETLKGRVRRDLRKIEDEYFEKFRKPYLKVDNDLNDRRLKIITILK